jgi:hypothetical protein
MAYSLDVKKKRLIVGVGLAIVGYFVFKKVSEKIFTKKSTNNQANFLNADGNNNDSNFVAKQYDATRNATWISYNNSDLIGYWQEGLIKRGTIVNSLM